MANNKEKLQKLLLLISELAKEPENNWFKMELSLMFGSKNVSEESNSDFAVIGDNVSEIKKYLSIDVIPIIDYSSVRDERVKNQLYRDCIEMGKYRLGKINDTINFGEFCRYAHLQAEELINYFLYKKFNSKIDNIIEFLKTQSNYFPKKLPNNINQIGYLNKVSSFKSFSMMPYNIYYDLTFLSEIRNELSHRNSLSERSEDNDLIKFHENGFSTDFVDFAGLTSEEKDIYNRGKFVITRRQERYIPIYTALEWLKGNVIELLDVKSAAIEIVIESQVDKRPVISNFRSKIQVVKKI